MYKPTHCYIIVKVSDALYIVQKRFKHVLLFLLSFIAQQFNI